MRMRITNPPESKDTNEKISSRSQIPCNTIIPPVNFTQAENSIPTNKLINFLTSDNSPPKSSLRVPNMNYVQNNNDKKVCVYNYHWAEAHNQHQVESN